MYFESYNKQECCGCTACQQICGVKAITMEKDEDGFFFPVKNIDICVECGLCERVCPMANPQYNNNTLKVYAAYLTDSTERCRSTSGGGFYAIAKYVLNRNGIVYGAVLTKSMQVIHKSASTLNELEPLRGSKYVQSNLLDTFSEIRELLRQGRWVYFTGTPCQVAGLKSFLIKEYDNLVTSDLICHGVPSQQLFDDHIEYIKKKYKTKRVYNYKFRIYETGEGGEIFNYINKKGKHKLHLAPSYELSPFLYSFIMAYTYRLSCYSCPFARLPRQGDITLGDFWGVNDYYQNVDASQGCSLILLNTIKGIKLWQDVNPEMFYIESNEISAAAKNKNLVKHTEYVPIRDNIYKLIHSVGYEQVAAKLFKSPNRFKIRVRYAIKIVFTRLHVIKVIRFTRYKVKVKV